MVKRLSIHIQAYYFQRHKRNPVREHKLDKFIGQKPFDSWRKSHHWKKLNIHDQDEFNQFRNGFPIVVYDNSRSRMGKPKKKQRARNDLFHFSYGPYQPEEAQIYLKHPSFIEEHFSCQLFEYKKEPKSVSKVIKESIEAVATGNAFSSNPTFQNPSELLDFHYNDWTDKSLKIVRFKVPSRHYGNTFYTVYLVYSSRVETKLEKDLASEPDSFFQNRVIDYICNCQVGLRSLGSCVHVGKKIHF